MTIRAPALVGCWWAMVALCAASLPTAAQDSTTPGTSDERNIPAPAALVDANYRLAEEDVLRVEVYNEQQLSNPQVQVTPDGKINIAYIGEVQAAGLTQAELAQSIAKKLEEAGILANARIQITVLSVHRPTCRVGGAVNRPGEVTFRDGDTIMDAIAQAGSYQDNAWLENAVLTRKGTSIPINLRKLYNEGDLSQNYELQKGDIIYIPPMTYENQIYVLGYVMKPGIYPFKENTTVL
ncbi:MAG: polysaccharide biosynthesis/export family protein, partial [Armatimonadota bacterium]